MAEGEKHVGRRRPRRVAGRGAGHRQAGLQCLGDKGRVVEGQVQGMRDACVGAAVQAPAVDLRQPLQQTPLESGDAPALLLEKLAGEGEGLAHTDDLVGRQGPGTQALLVSAAVDLRLQPPLGARPDVQRADALGPVGLVCGERHQVHRQAAQVDRHLAAGLRRVDVEQRAALAHPFADGGDVGQGAEFVVDPHQRHQAGIGAPGRLHLFRPDQAIGAGRQPGHAPAVIGKLLHGVQHRLVLQATGDQVAGCVQRLGHALEGQVVGFGGAGSPDNLPGAGADQRGHLLPGPLHCPPRLAAVGMGVRRGIAKTRLVAETFHHGPDHALVHGRGGGVIEVQR